MQRILLLQRLSAAGGIARRLRLPAPGAIRLPDHLAEFQGWMNKVWRLSHPNRCHFPYGR